ncbi:MAG: AAA family ATPase, partial [Actinomycetota bacterium]|nr:AAA family ATPase [Actinomycetota bacterium]
MARQPTATTTLTFADAFERVVANVEQVIQGKTDAIRLALCCLVAEGHLLIEDVPGVGKTSLAKALAASLGCTWHRIQFTPDLLPSDVTGASIYNRANGDFEFHPGPVFANLLVADEVNRASPKTQSALLEAMEERQVTVDASTFPLPAPFLVIATQNPVEHQGTYPLPESQLDRFLMRVPMGYPDRSSELAMLDTHGGGTAHAIDELEAVASPAQVLAMVRAARAVHVAPAVKGYM